MVNRKSQISIRDIQKLRSQLGGREGVSQKVTWPKRGVSKKATIGYEGVKILKRLATWYMDGPLIN